MIFLDYPGGTYTPPDPSDIGGIDANTVLMLHCDGTDTSTTFTDDSDSAHTVTANGDAQIDTAQSKFGGESGLFEAAADYLSMSTDTDFDFTTESDFCIDCWVRFLDIPDGVFRFPCIFANNSSTYEAGAISFQLNAYTKKIQVGSYDYYDSTSSTYLVSSTTDISENTWYHVAFVRLGTTFYLYLDGVLEDSQTASLDIDFSINGTLIAGGAWDAPDSYFNGHIDELRVSKGAARIDDSGDPLYCGGTPSNGFTPPAYAYRDKR